MDAAQAIDTVAFCETLMCLAGHTHQPCVIEYDRRHHRLARLLMGPQELSDVAFLDDPSAVRYLVNPGSVGQPRDGDPRAGFAVIDTELRGIAIRRVPYDVAAAQDKIRAAGLPAFFADRLAIGR